MESINDSLKYVAKSAQLVKDYIDINKIENEKILETVLELLEKTVEILSEAVHA